MPRPSRDWHSRSIIERLALAHSTEKTGMARSNFKTSMIARKCWCVCPYTVHRSDLARVITSFSVVCISSSIRLDLLVVFFWDYWSDIAN